MFWKTSFVSVLSVALMMTASIAQSAELKVGDDAPDFELKASDGKSYKLSSFKGKQAVVVAWFPKAFTGGCTKECRSMRENGKLIREYEVAYFTASVDPVDGEKGNAAFAKSLDLDYPILSDPEKKVSKEYGVLKPDGGVTNRWTFYISKDGKIQHIDKMVKTDTHAEDIAGKLKELGVAKAPKK
ncbi:MAG: peroxiredoxin [Planctomycetaceae bacterium]|nr:peroxiredoxin [Planctomycetaceae bacterium]